MIAFPFCRINQVYKDIGIQPNTEVQKELKPQPSWIPFVSREAISYKVDPKVPKAHDLCVLLLKVLVPCMRSTLGAYDARALPTIL